ncbi:MULTISPECIES: TIGR01777 family oxidoreductase [Parabacteroides]|uniref:TIGR01777 family oxidoreductase n=1 Tax=Parabacteroides leei TaxID=2939491 RepID=UPI001896E9D7|nr:MULTISPECIES: TIGR01777 family oxidoreductase [Parabacteroides]MCL3851376.1 TIGR01777 family oxidoreductase [Parabacteroides leei]
MKIAISGNSGFIGRHLTDFFSDRGNIVVPLKHSMFRLKTDDKLKEALTGCDVVINLAGTTINQRWTSKAKREIKNSRVYTTRRLVSILNEMPVKPKLFISASAVGIYPDKGIYSETSTSEGTGFLADVCIRWEEEAQKLSRDIRLVVARLGVVLSKDGGALPKMLLPFRFFVGGKIASGKQGFSWIHIEDVLNAIQFIIEHEDLSGVVNLVSPQPLTNRAFTRATADVLHRPAWLTIPGKVFRYLYGEGEELLTKGQQAYPARLLSAGYVFRYSDIRLALYSFLM